MSLNSCLLLKYFTGLHASRDPLANKADNHYSPKHYIPRQIVGKAPIWQHMAEKGVGEKSSYIQILQSRRKLTLTGLFVSLCIWEFLSGQVPNWAKVTIKKTPFGAFHSLLLHTD